MIYKLLYLQADFCDYQQDKGLVWQRGQPSKATIDHTTLTNKGKFAYVNFDNNTFLFDGRLISKPYSPYGDECLVFWYLMEGVGEASLRVHEDILLSSGDTATFDLWKKNSHEKDEWRFAQAEIRNTFFSYSVVFEAYRKNNFTGYVGIDDVVIKKGKCSPAIDCDFEEYSICSWLQYRQDDFDWLLNQGKTDTTKTGPHVDHTLGTDEGVYLYAESSYPAILGDKAIISSEFLDKTNTMGCFGLWYFMHGDDVGSLNVYMNDTVTGSRLMAGLNGEQGFAWQRLQVDVQSPNEFRIYIEATIGDGFNGDIAIDDLVYKPGVKCSGLPTISTTPGTTVGPCGDQGQFQCQNKKCITKEKVCNFVDDCGDASDEAECGTCDFETGMCGFYDGSEEQFRWTRRQAPSKVVSGPQVDHTTNSAGGSYLATYLDLDNGNYLSDAVLFGPPLQATGIRMIFLYVRLV